MMRYLTLDGTEAVFVPAESGGLPAETVIFPDMIAATVGYAVRDGVTVAVYDGDRAIEALMDFYGWSYEDAADWYGYNTVGTAINRGMPLLVEMGCTVCGEREDFCECAPATSEPKAA